MSTPTATTLATSGHEADASIRGYNYQAHVAAIKWCLLAEDEELHLEVAEDVAITGPAGALVIQVKDVARRLTLRSAHDFLDRVVVRLSAADGGARFQYLTTAPFGTDPDWRCAGERSFLHSWNNITGEKTQLDSMIAYLRGAARTGSALGEWLGGRTDEEVANGLFPIVHWIAEAPSLTDQEQRLSNEVASFCWTEFGLEQFKGRQLGRIVAGRIKELSAARDSSHRTLRRQDLRDLLLPHAKVSLEPREYADMAKAARLARQVPVKLLTQQLVSRLDDLKAGRFFPELESTGAARVLAADAMDDGDYALAAPEVRSDVLAWCARILVHQDVESSRSLLSASEGIAPVSQQRLVKALIEAESDVAAALRTLIGLDTAEAATVRYLVLRRGAYDEAVNWLSEEALTPSDLDKDGQFIVLLDALNHFDWQLASNWLERIDCPTQSEHPGLLWAAGLANYCIALPDYLREWAFNLRPTVIDEGLKTTVDAVAAKLRAIELFDVLEAQCRARGWTSRADLALEHALWLKLQHPDTKFSAKKRVSELFQRDLLSRSSQEHAFRWLPLALAAEQDVDKLAILNRIKSYAKLYRELDEDASWALFALMQHLQPELVLENWAFFYESLHERVNPVQLSSIRVQVLARTGALDEAKIALAEANLPTEVAKQLEALYLSKESSIDEVETTSPSARREFARRQRAAGDPASAIRTLEDVYRETSSLVDACNLVNLLISTGSLSSASDILGRLDSTFETDPRVASLKLRLALQLGNWQEGLNHIEAAGLNPEDELHQRIEIAIQALDWDEIPGLLQTASTLASAEPHSLLRAATVATTFGLMTIAQSATEEAVALADNDPSILMSAYMLAVKGNWEEKTGAGDWLMKAIATNDTKPEGQQILQRKSLQDLVDLTPSWNERNRSLNEMVKSAELFLAMAADATNESLMAVIFEAMRRNAAASDPSVRRVVPLFAGNDRARRIPDNARVALDCTALIVLGYLDLLDELPKALECIYLPHDFGLWLLNERDQTGHHQPSSVAHANDLIRWVVKRDIEIVPAKVRRGPLYREIGRELTDLIEACVGDTNERPSFVVHPYPIHSVGSAMTRLADLPASATARLVSVRGLVSALDRLGMLNADEATRASAFLSSHDEGWPSEPAIPTGATLYLDGLALTYLKSVGLIDRCVTARFKLKIHDETSREAVALASYQEDSSYRRELITKIQKFVGDGLRNGFVHSLPKSRPEPDDKDDRLTTKLLKQLFVDIPTDAVLIIDDRAGNRYASMTDASGTDHPVASTLDVLDRLHDLGILSERDLFAKRALLRESGCALIPVRPDEALLAAKDLSVVDADVEEGYFSRTLRESIQLLKISRYVALPLEEFWLTSTASAFRKAITSLWGTDGRTGDDERANWLFHLGKFSEFSASFLGDFDARRGLMQEALEVARYLVDPSLTHNHAYWSWVEHNLCQPLLEERPAVFSLLLEVLKSQLLRLKNEYPKELRELLKMAEDDASRDLAAIAGATLLVMPKIVKAPLLEDELFCRELGVSVTRQITAHTSSRPTFNSDELYEAARKAWNDSDSSTLASDDKGQLWTLTRLDGNVIARLPDMSESFEVAFAPLFSDRREDREQQLLQLVAEVGGDERFENRWRSRLMTRPLDVGEIVVLRRELRASPFPVRSSISDALREASILPQQLIPDMESHFFTLSGLAPEQTTLPTAEGSLTAWGSTVASQDRLRLSLFRCIHSRFAPVSLLDGISTSELEKWIDEWVPTLDSWSIVGLIESLCQSSRPAQEVLLIIRPLLSLAKDVLAPNSSRMVLSAALAAFVDQRVALAGLLSTVSPSARRLASFSHAAMLEAELLEAQTDLSKFSEWLEQFQMPFHAVSLADVHLEPRWSAVFLSPAQLGFELTGRVATAVKARPEIADAEVLRDLLHDPDGVVSRHHMVYGGLPGPLEGATGIEQGLPEALQDQLRDSLNTPGANLVESMRFAGHVGMLGGLAPDVARRICDGLTTLIDSDSSLLGTEDGGQAYVMLCHLAASLRDTEMARLLSRAVTDEGSMSPGLRVYLKFLCCAANADRVSWAKALDLVALELSRDEGGPSASHSHFILQSICAVRTDILPLVQHRLASYVE